MQAILIIIPYIIISLLHVLIIQTSTHIGAKGHRNAILQGIFNISEGLLLIAFGWVSMLGLLNKMLSSCIICIGIILLICGVVNTVAAVKENSDDLVTETLSDVRITPAGYYNFDRRIEGTVNGEYRWFMIRGADKSIAKDIKERGIAQVTITYHPSNRRIEQILL